MPLAEMDAARTRLERSLGRRVRDAVWAYLVERGYSQEVIDDLPGAFDGLVREARALEDIVRRAGNGSDPSDEEGTRRPFRAASNLEARADALSALHGELAAADHRTVRFRTSILKRWPLSREEARALIRSPAAAVYSDAILEHVGIPVPHASRLVRDAVGALLIEVAWPGGRKSLPVPEYPMGRETRRLRYAEPGARPARAEVDPGSLLDDLREAAEELAGHYLWNPADAAAFLLEDIEPPVIPATVQIRQRVLVQPPTARIVIEAEAWVPAAVIEEEFRRTQGFLFRGARRPIAERTAAMVAFVTRYRRGRPSATWPQLLEAWNSAQDEASWQWPAYRAFRRDYERAKDLLLNPRFKIPGVDE